MLLCTVQGDLFSEAPKPAVPQEKKAVSESVKSTEQNTGETVFINVYRCF